MALFTSLYENEQGEEYATVQWSPATLQALSDSILHEYAIHNLSPYNADVLLADLRLTSLDESPADTDNGTVYQNISARLKQLQAGYHQLLRSRRILGVIIGVLGLGIAATLGVRLLNIENAAVLQVCDSLCAWNVASSSLDENIFKIPIKLEFLAHLPQATLVAFLLTALSSLKLLWRPGVVPQLLLAGFSVVQINLVAQGWIAPILCFIIPFTLYELYLFRPKVLRGSTQIALSILMIIGIASLSAPVAVSAKGFTFTQTASNNNSAERGTQKQEKYWVAGVCDGCKKEIETAVKGVKGVTKAEWDLKTKTVTIDYNAAQTSPDALKKALVATGRKVKSPKP
ncbi:MAG: heavy-metal-associated domain-containing protein [Ignavibacteria bacterium]|nr:heavy-metal-associated domain-containing protein [Ignavibacteria bacterium]